MQETYSTRGGVSSTLSGEGIADADIEISEGPEPPRACAIKGPWTPVSLRLLVRLLILAAALTTINPG